MAKHTISIHAAMEYQLVGQIAASYGKGDNKTLLVIVQNGVVYYRVINNDKDVINTQNLLFAVDAYNNV